MSYDDRTLVGVGGWLAFFVIVLAVFTPIRAALSMFELYSDPALADFFADRWPAVQAVEWALAAASVGGAWYLAWRLNQEGDWSTVRVVVAGVWLLGLGVLVVELLAVSLLAALPIADLVAGTGIEFGRALFSCGLWTAYLLNSRRVANTFPKHVDADVFA